MRLRYWVLLLALLVAHFAGYSPIGAALDLCSHCWLAWRSSRVPAIADNSLNAAIRNVTGDFDQLADIVKDFFSQRDPEAEERFRLFLEEKAHRSHAKLERALDWLLAIYKVALPILICMLMARGSNGKDDDTERPDRIKAIYSKSPSSGSLYKSTKDSFSTSSLLESTGPYSVRGSSSHRSHHALDSSKRQRSTDLAMRASGF
ncbi:g4096 [Coccomyxa elongata]